MFIVIRAITYATLFIGLFLVLVPARILSAAGIHRPAVNGWEQVAGVALVIVGMLLAWWCILTFALLGKGTPALFDAPRRLVVKGPYRYLRNPMYVGAGLALVGAALYYTSLALGAYAFLFLVLGQVVIVLYEEPTLTRTFGDEYIEYTKTVGRWFPRKHIPVKKDNNE